jgi:hypothetical protein
MSKLQSLCYVLCPLLVINVKVTVALYTILCPLLVLNAKLYEAHCGQSNLSLAFFPVDAHAISIYSLNLGIEITTWTHQHSTR